MTELALVSSLTNHMNEYMLLTKFRFKGTMSLDLHTPPGGTVK